MTDKTKKTGMLSFRTKLGYSIGQLTDSSGFSVWLYFFLYFLTDCAGVSPAAGGAIIFIAGVWDAVTDPVMGYISDNTHSKYGRRRPYMIAGCIPYALCCFLLFTNVDLGGNAKVAYYLVIAMLFWSAYKTYVIPYFALGAEITSDFDERTSIRSWAGIFLYVAVLLASATPMLIVEKVESVTGSLNTGWSAVGVVFAFIVFTAAFICWTSTRGKEPSTEARMEQSECNFFKNFLQVFKLKPVGFLAISVLCWGLITNLLGSSLVYLMENNLGFSATKESGFFIYMSAVTILLIPLINFLAKKFDKKNIYVLAMGLSAVIFISFGFLGLTGLTVLMVFITFIQFGDGTFWTLYYSMMYDISELDEYVFGKRREGTISAILSFTQKIGAALSGLLLGALLSAGGYDASLDVQVESAQHMILYTSTFVPGAFAVIGALTGLLYPITKTRFQALNKAIADRKNGNECDISGFEKMLWRSQK